MKSKQNRRFTKNRVEALLPITDEFMFLALQFNEPFQFDEKNMGTYRPPGDYFNFSHKKSLFLRKIMQLSRHVVYDFGDRIIQKYKIPVSTFRDIFFVLTEEKELHLINGSFPTLVPNLIPIEDRARYLLAVSREVYNVLEEAFFVLMVTGMVECQRFKNLEVEGNFQKMKAFLFEGACYPDMENRIAHSKSINELKEYFQEHFSVFSSFYPRFNEFYKKSVQPLINKGVLLRNRALKIRTGGSVQEKISHRDIDKIQEKVFKSFFKEEVSEGGENEWSGDGESEWSEGAELTHDDLEDLSGEIHERMMNPSLRSHVSRRKTDDFRSEKWEKEGFSYDVEIVLQKQLLKGLVSSYKLRGNSFNLIGYLKAIFRNAARTASEKDYNASMKEEKGISVRTARRYKKELEQDKKPSSEDNYDQDNSSHKNTLSQDLIETMRKKNLEKQKHHISGSLTQNQIIKGLKDRGLGSPTTLKRKIRKLVELGKIQYENKDGTYRFEASNLNKIVEEIKNL